MVPMPPAAPVKRISRDLSNDSAMLQDSCEFAVALERTREMVAHGAARLGRISGDDAIDDAAMLLLDALEVGAPLGQRADLEPHALARDHMAAQESEKARKLAVAGRLGDGAMEGEILGDGAIALAQGTVDGAERGADAGKLAFVGAFRRLRRRLDLDGEPKLH